MRALDNWQFPRRSEYGRWQATRTRVAERRWTLGINRIHGHPIGVYAVIGKWSYGVCRPISGEERRRKQAESTALPHGAVPDDHHPITSRADAIRVWNAHSHPPRPCEICAELAKWGLVDDD